MKIKINRAFKSLIAGKEVELPDFCVLTGKNGSGKSHFLEAISKKDEASVSVNGTLIPDTDVGFIAFNGLNPNIDDTCNQNSLNQNIPDCIRFLSEIQQHSKQYRITDKHKWFASNWHQWRGRSPQYERYKNAIEKISVRIKKDFDEITEDDIRIYSLASDFYDKDVFDGQFAKIFKSYQLKLDENEYRDFQNKKRGTSYKVLSDNEFIEMYGAKPWEFVNEILKDAQIPYMVSNPEGQNRDSSFYFKLTDYQKGVEIKPRDLSTGEKVLMSLALAIYNSAKDNIKNKVLLIDEPDAALHPEFSRFLLSTLKNHIVKKAGIKVIITTHSPTTVAMADEESLFEMDKEEKIPRKVSRQEALSILTADIPSLRVSIDKRRIVFVESTYDADNYEKIHEWLKSRLKLEIQPTFYAPHNREGTNSSDVKELMDKLAETDGVYGVVDYDGGNNISSEKIKVMGECGEHRYTIENYIFDPIFVGLSIIHDNLDPNKPQISYPHFDDLPNSEKQNLIDWVMNELELNKGAKVRYETISNECFEINTDWVNLKGHDLERRIIERWPSFKQLMRGNKGDNALKSVLLNTVIRDFSQYLSIDFKRLFESLH